MSAHLPVRVPPRLAELTVEPMKGEVFLSLVQHSAHAEEAGGKIKSQYEKELRAGDESVTAYAFRGCGKTVGALSFGVLDLPKVRGTVGGRIDVVVTPPEFRGLGIAGLLLAWIVRHAADTYGERLLHISVIAQHPTIGRYVTALGFESRQCGKIPLHSIDLTSENRPQVRAQAHRTWEDRRTALKLRCLQCQKYRRLQPWCERKDEE